MDYGTDNYAGVTWSNTGKRKIFLGWMSNWQYANKVPTEKWRSANTVARDLSLAKINGSYYVRSTPVKELSMLEGKKENHLSDVNKTFSFAGPQKIQINLSELADFSVVLSNGKNEQCTVGFDKANNSFFIDRTAAGIKDFNRDFARKMTAKRISTEAGSDITLIIDDSSIELFADKGVTVMTSIFFPTENYNLLQLKTDMQSSVKSYTSTPLQSIWK
jgi:fructan beta-fructosidase